MPGLPPLASIRQALASRLLGPPPLLWRLGGWRPVLLWRGVEAGQWPHTLRSWLALLPLVLQQLHWWSARVLRQALWRRRLRKRRPNATPLPPPLPRRLALAACWLNNFQSHAVRQWQTVGVGRWAELSTKLPDSHCGAFHSQRRQGWPQRCRPALRLLADKAALLEHTPPIWRSPWLALPLPPDASSAPPGLVEGGAAWPRPGAQTALRQRLPLCGPLPLSPGPAPWRKPVQTPAPRPGPWPPS